MIGFGALWAVKACVPNLTFPLVEDATSDFSSRRKIKHYDTNLRPYSSPDRSKSLRLLFDAWTNLHISATFPAQLPVPKLSPESSTWWQRLLTTQKWLTLTSNINVNVARLPPLCKTFLSGKNPGVANRSPRFSALFFDRGRRRNLDLCSWHEAVLIYSSMQSMVLVRCARPISKQGYWGWTD